MKKLLLLTLMVSFWLPSFASYWIKITFTDGSTLEYHSLCCFTEYNRHPKYIWYNSYAGLGGENPDWYCVSDWSDSGLYWREEDDYKALQKAVQKAGRTCEIDIHNWEKDKDGHLHCWWFIRMKSDEVERTDYYIE